MCILENILNFQIKRVINKMVANKYYICLTYLAIISLQLSDTIKRNEQYRKQVPQKFHNQKISSVNKRVNNRGKEKLENSIKSYR